MFRRVTIRDNYAEYGGGGLYLTGSQVTIHSSTISENTARDGGGIYLLTTSSTARLINSTVSGNHAGASGGGIRNGIRLQSGDYSGTVVLENVTVTNNTADGIDSNPSLPFAVGGGGLAGPATLRNSIIAGNSDTSNRGDDCVMTQTSQGYNLIGDTSGCTIIGTTDGNQLNVDPLLGPLKDLGRGTKAHRPLAGSPAIDSGNPQSPGSNLRTCKPLDQRGVARPRDGDGDGSSRCDIGAIER